MIRALAVLVCVSPLIAIGGCQGQDRAPAAARDVKNVYDLSLTLDLRDASGAEEFYTVDRDGLFAFGGGMDARFERTSFSTQLAPEDMQRLQQVIEDQRLLTASLGSSIQPKDVRYEIKLKSGGDSLDERVKGADDRLEGLRGVLKDFANRRLASELERQPKPSIATQPGAAVTPATQPR